MAVQSETLDWCAALLAWRTLVNLGFPPISRFVQNTPPGGSNVSFLTGVEFRVENSQPMTKCVLIQDAIKVLKHER